MSIINNQIGFSHQSGFLALLALSVRFRQGIEAPIFHVNGDDPEAVVFAAKIATEYRMMFHKPVVIDMFCYRRFGHNEGDEPAFTQPKCMASSASIHASRRSTPRSSLPRAW